ncbi:hypothetical protein V8E36_002883 [Tilletia maclaganii]
MKDVSAAFSVCRRSWKHGDGRCFGTMHDRDPFEPRLARFYFGSPTAVQANHFPRSLIDAAEPLTHHSTPCLNLSTLLVVLSALAAAVRSTPILEVARDARLTGDTSSPDVHKIFDDATTTCGRRGGDAQPGGRLQTPDRASLPPHPRHRLRYQPSLSWPPLMPPKSRRILYSKTRPTKLTPTGPRLATAGSTLPSASRAVRRRVQLRPPRLRHPSRPPVDAGKVVTVPDAGPGSIPGPFNDADGDTLQLPGLPAPRPNKDEGPVSGSGVETPDEESAVAPAAEDSESGSTPPRPQQPEDRPALDQRARAVAADAKSYTAFQRRLGVFSGRTAAPRFQAGVEHVAHSPGHVHHQHQRFDRAPSLQQSE